MCSVLAQSIKSFYFCVLGHPEDKEPAGVRRAEIKRFNMVRALSVSCSALSGIRSDTGHRLRHGRRSPIYNIIPLKRFTTENPEKAPKNCLL